MIHWPNMLLVAGTGRNVGKTTFVCKIIENISKQSPIVAIKITPHIHDFCSSCVPLFQSDNLVIAEETSTTLPKDSSKMLSAGAQKVYFVQGADNQLNKVLEFLQPLIKSDCAVVCESAGLRNFIKPGLFVLMSIDKNEPIIKNVDKIKWADKHIYDYQYEVGDFQFKNEIWVK